TTITEEKTVLETKEWLKRSLAPTLALVYKAFDNDIDQIAEIIDEGCNRLKTKHYEMIRKHQEGIKKAPIVCETIRATEK
ncbi:hypothetical protein J0817_29915, partial [Bacillus mobilis]